MSALRRLLVINGGGYTLLDHIRTNKEYCTTPYKLKTTDKVELTITLLSLESTKPSPWYGIFGSVDNGNDFSFLGYFDGETLIYRLLRFGWRKSFTNIWASSLKPTDLNKDKIDVTITSDNVTINGVTTVLSGNANSDAQTYAKIGMANSQFNAADINVYQFSVNGEIWYPCKKGDIYGLYCPMRDLNGAQESDYWIYNEKFTGD